ncbi:glycosyltransferase family 4 protein [Zoogloea sp. LCSB751]|uniref:glycosyltransferase family 4 protein n=1 Tax=Zoogloea sp. LCSB751 TaxID=1965277 RepID=UPI0009A4F66F|nr:glycosyltransferase family 4 protein [Zoogloea sp. LCSB751]
MNVVIVNDYDYVQGGASKIAIESANLLASSGCRVIFFCGVSDQGRSDLKGVEVVVAADVDFLSNPSKLKGAAQGIFGFTVKDRMARLLARLDKRNTVVHFHGWTKALSSSVFDAVFQAGFRSVLTLHDFFVACPNGGFYNYQNREICEKKSLSLACLMENCDSRSYTFKLYRSARLLVQNSVVGVNSKVDAYLYISKFSHRLIAPYLAGRNSLVEYLPNPISMEKPAGRVRVEENDFFLYVGRLSKEKGVEVFCEATRRAGKRAIVVGDGELLGELKARFGGADSCIKFVGWKQPHEVADYIRNARCFVFPSLWYETFGLTVCEALAQGVPCLVSSDTAAIDFIDGKNGLVFPRNDVSALANAMIEIDSNENLGQMSEQAFGAYWRAPFSSARYEQRLLDLYSRLLGS